jgi:hypothetical protein
MHAYAQRLRVRLHSHSLDQALADGVTPGRHEELALRAQQLADRSMRNHLAGALRRVVSDAQRPGPPLPNAAAPVSRSAVLPWCEGLLGLAERLDGPEPLNACGIARVALLLSESAGPLYNHPSSYPLEKAVWWAADGLQPCPPHAWASPVIMKLDPEHVAWTCTRCGAIAVSDSPSVRPL